MALNDKQSLFVQEYLIDLNATQAAIRAGYSKKTAGSQGFDLLKKPEIMEALQNAMDERVKRTGITADYVLDSLKSVADRCMQAEQVMDRDGVATGDYKFDASGASRALELLGKNLKLFTDKVEHSGNIGLYEVPEEELDARIKRLQEEG